MWKNKQKDQEQKKKQIFDNQKFQWVHQLITTIKCANMKSVQKQKQKWTGELKTNYRGSASSWRRNPSSFASVMQTSSFIRASVGPDPNKFLAAKRWSVLKARRASSEDGSSGTSELTETSEVSAFSSTWSVDWSPIESQTCATMPAKSSASSSKHSTSSSKKRSKAGRHYLLIMKLENIAA